MVRAAATAPGHFYVVVNVSQKLDARYARRFSSMST